MKKAVRSAWIVLGLLVVAVLLVVVLLPLVLNADSFRTRVEAALTHSLGRPVTMSKLSLAIWTGSLDAKNIQIADDPAFSNQPFVQADTLRIRVQVLPLLLHHQVHVEGFTVIDPKVDLLRTANGKWNYSTLGNNAATPANASGSGALANFTAGNVRITHGSITVSQRAPGSSAAQQTLYQNVTLDIKQFSATSAFPFTLSAVFPSGGTLSASGEAGPLNQQDTAATPVHAQATLHQVHLATAGVLPADAGIGGIVDSQAEIQSDGHTLQATGSAQVNSIKLARNASPATSPLQLRFHIEKDEQQNKGQIQQMTVSTGGATFSIVGNFTGNGPSTDLNLQVSGNQVPIDSLEAFLPAVGVHLPQGSQLRGGTLTTTLKVTGSSGSPNVSGPVQLANTQLAGFDLGAKLATLSALTGGRIGKATGSGTNIRSLTMDLQESGGNLRTDNVNLDIAGLGTATGSGTVSASTALNYNMLLKLTGLTGSAQPASQQSDGNGLSGIAGSLMGLVGGSSGSAGALGAVGGALLSHGIPVAIGGTASNPTFAPNLAGLTKTLGVGVAKQVLGGKHGSNNQQANPLKNVLGGLFGH